MLKTAQEIIGGKVLISHIGNCADCPFILYLHKKGDVVCSHPAFYEFSDRIDVSDYLATDTPDNCPIKTHPMIFTASDEIRGDASCLTNGNADKFWKQAIE